MAMKKIKTPVGDLTFPVYKYMTNVVKNLLNNKLHYSDTFAFCGRMYGIFAYDEETGILYLYEFKSSEDSGGYELCSKVYDPVVDEIFKADLFRCDHDVIYEWKNGEGEKFSTRFMGWFMAKSPA